MTYLPSRMYELERFRGCTQGYTVYNVIDPVTNRIVGSAIELPGGVLEVRIGVGQHASTYYVRVPNSYYPLRYIYLP